MDILARTWVETTPFCITSNRKRPRFQCRRVCGHILPPVFLWRSGEDLLWLFGWLVGCGLTSHSAIFLLYSDGTVVRYQNLDMLLGTTPLAARGLPCRYYPDTGPGHPKTSLTSLSSEGPHTMRGCRESNLDLPIHSRTRYLFTTAAGGNGKGVSVVLRHPCPRYKGLSVTFSVWMPVCPLGRPFVRNFVSHTHKYNTLSWAGDNKKKKTKRWIVSLSKVFNWNYMPHWVDWGQNVGHNDFFFTFLLPGQHPVSLGRGD